jgi:hypothetical protein
MKAKYLLSNILDYQKAQLKKDITIDIFKDGVKNYIREGSLERDIELFLRKIVVNENIGEYFSSLYQEISKLDMKNKDDVDQITNLALEHCATYPFIILLFKCVYEIFKKDEKYYESDAIKSFYFITPNLKSAVLGIVDVEKINGKIPFFQRTSSTDW